MDSILRPRGREAVGKRVEGALCASAEAALGASDRRAVGAVDAVGTVGHGAGKSRVVGSLTAGAVRTMLEWACAPTRGGKGGRCPRRSDAEGVVARDCGAHAKDEAKASGVESVVQRTGKRGVQAEVCDGGN